MWSYIPQGETPSEKAREKKRDLLDDTGTSDPFWVRMPERERKTSSLELLTLGLEDRLSHKQTDTFCQKGNAADRQAGWPVD